MPLLKVTKKKTAGPAAEERWKKQVGALNEEHAALKKRLAEIEALLISSGISIKGPKAEAPSKNKTAKPHNKNQAMTKECQPPRKRKLVTASSDEEEAKETSDAKRTNGQTDNEMETTTTEEDTYAARAKRVPPVVIEGTEDWKVVRRRLNEKEIKISKAKVQGGQTRVFPETPKDYRQLNAMLDEQKRAYYTYTLEEDRKIHAVIRGLPLDTSTEDIKEELKAMGHGDLEVARMTSRRTLKAIPLFLVKANNRDIFKITRLYDLVVIVENKKKTEGPTQCYRCQRYGHTQSRCSYPFRCVKCAGAHKSAECERPVNKEQRNASCVNCGEEGHPASYRGCKKYPKRTPQPQKQQPKNEKAKTTTKAPVRPKVTVTPKSKKESERQALFQDFIAFLDAREAAGKN